MSATRQSPDFILPTRMTLHVPSDTPLCFSLLDFPYGKAIDSFMSRFRDIYQYQHAEKLPFYLQPPYRQLNDALLALAPSLIQPFEKVSGVPSERMVTFTKYERRIAEDFPTLPQLSALIRFWLERWATLPDVAPILHSDGKSAWQTLMDAFNGNPETDWQHGISPVQPANDLNYEKGLAFVALPSLLTALLHGKQMVIQSQQKEQEIVWRRAHDGGKNGLHLVSQPIQRDDDFFAYCLRFSVQTQAGEVDSRGSLRTWIFAETSIQRYIAEGYRGGDKNRDVSILVGCNGERFSGGWERDTTLIRLSVDWNNGNSQWESGVGALLDDFAVRRLESPAAVLADPRRYGNYGNSVAGDEYYVVYAEGRKFGDERARAHQIPTGMALRERSQIMRGVFDLLGGWLEVSPPFEKDTQNPYTTLALRDYDHMAKVRKNSKKERESWRMALETSLANAGHEHLHVVVLYRTPEFHQWAKAQIEQALMGTDTGDTPLVTDTYMSLRASLYFPLDSGGLDPALYWKPREHKPAGFMTEWRNNVRAGYQKKREEWRNFLRGVNWQPNARRLLLIDSTGEAKIGDVSIPDDQKIKGAIRDACNREGILSQFLVGNFKLDKRKEHEGKLDGDSAGRLKHATLDLLVRQQGILFAPPREIYERAAKLDKALASELDVIAFCRVERTKPYKLRYVLAVRLRASGEVDVMLPGDTRWLPYDKAAHKLGMLFSEQRPHLWHNGASPLRLGNNVMLRFVREILTQRLERPTLAVIDAESWRNARTEDDEKRCWTQLRNTDLSRSWHLLDFDFSHKYERDSPALDLLLGVLRLRMGDETPQYVTAGDWAAEETMRDIAHLTGYVDPCGDLLHYMSVAGLPQTQKTQAEHAVVEAFKKDIRAQKRHDIAYKHPQLVELVPFFVHPRFKSDEGQRQLCRCVHFLRISPAFSMGNIITPYPMHLGVSLIEDQLCIISVDE